MCEHPTDSLELFEILHMSSRPLGNKPLRVAGEDALLMLSVSIKPNPNASRQPPPLWPLLSLRPTIACQRPHSGSLIKKCRQTYQNITIYLFVFPNQRMVLVFTTLTSILDGKRERLAHDPYGNFLSCVAAAPEEAHEAADGVKCAHLKPHHRSVMC